MSCAPFIIVSAVNQAYWPLWEDLLRSLERVRSGGLFFDIGLLDLGVDPAAVAAMTARGVIVQKADVDIDYPGREAWEAARPYYRAMTARPFLPEYFPGYPAIMWLDSDTWVQTSEALAVMSRAALHDDRLYIVSEYDLAYQAARRGAAFWQVWQQSFHQCFPPEVAAEMCLWPMLNSGVFAMSAASPVWTEWAAVLAGCLGRVEKLDAAYFLAEQLSLNIVARQRGFCAMPQRFNWLAPYGAPVWDEKERLFVHPCPPYQPLSVLHLAGEIKGTHLKLQKTDGGEVVRSLTYRDWALAR